MKKNFVMTILLFGLGWFGKTISWKYAHFRRKRASEDRDKVRKHLDILFPHIKDANDILTELSKIHKEYGIVYVSDFLDLAGIETSFEDSKYVWGVDPSKGAKINCAKDGYRITFATMPTLCMEFETRYSNEPVHL